MADGRGRWIAVSCDLLNAKHELHPHARGQEACDAFAWVDIIGLANWKDGGGLRRGELRASHRFLASRWNWGRKRVARFLDRLSREGSIERDRGTSREPDRIRIVKYDRYQMPRPADDPANRPADDPADDPKEVEVHKPLQETDTDPDGSAARDLRLYRARREMSADLQDLADLGTDPLSEEERGPLVQAMVAAWVSMQSLAPSEAEKAKQGRKAKQMAAKYSPFRIAVAMRGISELFPYSDGKPWDLFDVDRRVSNAVEVGWQMLIYGGGSEADRRVEEIRRETYEDLTRENGR